MKPTCLFSAYEAPPPPHHAQAARVAGRVRVSPAVADLIANLAWGHKRRDDDALLVTMTLNRCATAAEARL